MPRSHFLGSLFALFLMGAAGSLSAKPNVLVIVADQWRAQAFGYAGDPNVKTPNIDRLAAQSVNFVNATSGVSVCSPFRASLLTGQRPLTHGVFINDTPLNPEAATIGKSFKGAGYETGFVGKWHVDGHGRSAFIPRERRQGFDYWKVLECTHDYNHSPYYADTDQKLFWEGYDALAQTHDVCAYLKAQQRKGKPFVMFLTWGPPHNPYGTAPKKYADMYQAADIKLRPNVAPDSAEEAKKELAGYYAHCSALDDCMGEILRTLHETGLEDDTLLLFTADHGDMIHSHHEIRKQRPWEESVHTPLLMHWPKGLGKEGRVAEAMINSEDLMPTLLGLSGVAIPQSVEGHDFTGYLLKNEKDPSGGATVIACPSPFGEYTRLKGGREYRGVRTQRYTYVRTLEGPWLLFDNKQDPYQMNNLVGVAGQEGLQKEMDDLLKRKLKEEHDDFRPGAEYIAKWGYQVDKNGTMPYRN